MTPTALATDGASSVGVQVIRSSGFAGLRRIAQAPAQLAIWERAEIPAIMPALDALLGAGAAVQMDLQNPAHSEIVRSLTSTLLDSAAPTEAFAALAADFLQLANEFRTITGRQHFRLRFERVEDDGCALFHVDTLPMRMLCTYAGPGTQWLEENNVRREQLGSRGRDLEAANAAIVIDPERIRTEPAWHVLVFKGRLWDGHGYSDGLVHRSAPVRHSRDYRLRLTIDFSESCAC